MEHYISRLVDEPLARMITGLPAIAIDGAKGVGKTSTAKRFAKTTIRLDKSADHEIVAASPEIIQTKETPVLLDEWQRLPIVWDEVKRAVDEDSSPGRFLLTGSAYPINTPTHSGSARVVRLRMRPLSLEERSLDKPVIGINELLSISHTPQLPSTTTEVKPTDYVHEILVSGFPGIRPRGLEFAADLLEGYIDNIVEREFPEQGFMVRKPHVLREWLKSYAAATSTTVSYETILAGATPGQADKPAKKTTQNYRAVLDSLFLLDQIEPWMPTYSSFRYAGKAPKHHLVDPALAARLLDVTEDILATGNNSYLAVPQKKPLIGRLFESLVAQSLHTYVQRSRAKLRHLRTSSGDHEIDFIVEKGNRILAIETKYQVSTTTKDADHLNWLEQRFPEYDIIKMIVTAGPIAHITDDNVLVVPAALLGA